MKTKTAKKAIFKHKEMTGKVIGISEEKNRSKLVLLLKYCDVEVETKNQKYELGEKVDLDLDVEAIRLKSYKR